MDAANKDSDMDQLTSGIKKIRIKVPSNEEYAARQKKPTTLAEKNTTGAKPVVKKPAAPRASKATNAPKKLLTKDIKDKVPKALAPKAATASAPSPVLNGAPTIMSKTAEVVPTPPASNGAQISGPDVSSTPSGLANGHATAGPVSTSGTTLVDTKENLDVQPNGKLKTETLFEAYQPPRQQTQHYPVSNAPSQPLQWLPPNSDPAIPQLVKPSEVARTQREAPVFSANGFIPFAPFPVSAAQEEVDIAQQTAGSNGQIGGSAGEVKLEGTDKADGEVDIWQVPDTPAR
jgi:histone deacetylase HOS3